MFAERMIVGLFVFAVACPPRTAVPARLTFTEAPVADERGFSLEPIEGRIESDDGASIRSFRIPSGRRVLQAEMSASRDAAWIWSADRGGVHRSARHDAHDARRDCERELEGDATHRGELEPTPYGGVLHTWSAGTYAAQAELIDVRCESKMSVAAAAVDVAPSTSHLASYSPMGAPRASARVAAVYELRSGGRVGEIPLGADEGVDAVVWSSAAVELRIVDESGRRRIVRIALDDRL